MYFLFWVFTFPWAGKTQCDNFSWCWAALLKWVTDSSQPWSHSKNSISSVCHLSKMFASLGVFKSIFHLGHFNLHWISGFFFFFTIVWVAVIKQLCSCDKTAWLVYLTSLPGHSPSVREIRAGAKAGTPQECCFLARFLWITQLAFYTTQDHLARGDTSHYWLALLYQSLTKKMPPQPCSLSRLKKSSLN